MVIPPFDPCSDNFPESKDASIKVGGLNLLKNTSSVLRIILIAQFFSSQIIYVIDKLQK